MPAEDLKISENALTILLATDADLHRTVMHMKLGLLEHWSFETCEQTIASGTDLQLHSQWEAALCELVDRSLLKKDGYDVPQFYRVTERGSEVAQLLRVRHAGSDEKSLA
jgi:hypothetical protein